MNEKSTEQQLLRIPTGRRQTDWPFTCAAEKLNQVLPGSNSTRGFFSTRHFSCDVAYNLNALDVDYEKLCKDINTKVNSDHRSKIFQFKQLET